MAFTWKPSDECSSSDLPSWIGPPPNDPRPPLLIHRQNGDLTPMTDEERRQRPYSPYRTADRAGFPDFDEATAARYRASLLAAAPKSRGPWVSASNAAAIIGFDSTDQLFEVFDRGELCETRLVNSDGSVDSGVRAGDLAIWMRRQAPSKRFAVGPLIHFTGGNLAMGNAPKVTPVVPHAPNIPNLSPQVQQPTPVQKITPPPPSPNRPSVGGQNAHPNPNVATYHSGPERPANAQLAGAEIIVESQQPYRH